MKAAVCPACGTWRVVVFADSAKRPTITRRHEPCGVVTVPPAARLKEIGP